MSTAPLRPPNSPPSGAEELSILVDEEMRLLADQDDCVMNPRAAALGMVRGILIGAALWAGCILAAIIIFRR